MASSYSIAEDNHRSRTEGFGPRWLYFAGAMIAYKFLLEQSYVYIAYAYDYQNLFLNNRTSVAAILSWMMLIAALPATKRVFDDKSTSGSVLSLLILFSVIPSIVAISFRSDYSATYIILLSIFWLIFFLAWSLLRPIRFDHLSRIQTNSIYIILAVGMSVAVIVYSYINTGLRLHFDLISVYDIRAEARDFTAPFPFNYLLSFSDNLLPVIAIYMLVKKRRIAALLIFIVVFVNFSITGTKQILFVPIVGIIGYFVFRRAVSNYSLLAFGAIFAVICNLEVMVSDSGTLNGLFTYRVLFIPTELHYSYYSYFQSHDLLYYGQSLLKAFSDSGQENIQFIIGEYAIADYTARANNGLFSDAYMNLGVIGVLIYPVLLALFLRILDGAMDGLPPSMSLVVVIYVSFVLLGMTLTSALFTSGLIVLILLLYSFPRDEPRFPGVPLGKAALAI